MILVVAGSIPVTHPTFPLLAQTAGTPFTRCAEGREPRHKGAVTGNPPRGTRQGVQHLVKDIWLWENLGIRLLRV